MPQADTEQGGRQIEIDVEFDAGIQSLDALEAAAYRLIGTATCQIEKKQQRFVCRLKGTTSRSGVVDAEALRTKFVDFVTDENLRARIAKKTDGVRNVILALAFGSLAKSEETGP
jgi:His-Xaa-Ser system protein HxsD